MTGISRMNVPGDLANFLDSPDPIYGTGSDGDITLDGTSTVLGMVPNILTLTYSMTSDLYFDDLIIHDGVTLAPNGYRIFVKNTLSLGTGSVIGFESGYAIAGSIAQGGLIDTAVTNSLGGASLTQIVTPPTAALGGSKYYQIPHQAVRGYAVSASNTTPTFLRGGAGGLLEPGGGIVIIAARHISGPATGNAYIKAPGTLPAGGGVILIVSSAAHLPGNVLTDVSGANPGTFNYMQLV
jgi:hypothetical protein